MTARPFSCAVSFSMVLVKTLQWELLVAYTKQNKSTAISFSLNVFVIITSNKSDSPYSRK